MKVLLELILILLLLLTIMLELVLTIQLTFLLLIRMSLRLRKVLLLMPLNIVKLSIITLDLAQAVKSSLDEIHNVNVLVNNPYNFDEALLG
ncbi:hypothetical protein B9K06_25965, partial [Bacillus sp. OG2]